MPCCLVPNKGTRECFQFLALEIEHHFIYILVRSDEKTPAVLIGTKAKNISKEYAI